MLLNISRYSILLVFMALSINQGKSEDNPETWATYTNNRFQYRVCYPKYLLTPQGEPANRDGQVFSNDDGTELSVFGQYKINLNTIENNIKLIKENFTKEDVKITYQTIHKKWAVISGKNPDYTLYDKIIDKGDFYLFVELKYKNNKTYDSLIKNITNCTK